MNMEVSEISSDFTTISEMLETIWTIFVKFKVD